MQSSLGQQRCGLLTHSRLFFRDCDFEMRGPDPYGLVFEDGLVEALDSERVYLKGRSRLGRVGQLRLHEVYADGRLITGTSDPDLEVPPPSRAVG